MLNSTSVRAFILVLCISLLIVAPVSAQTEVPSLPSGGTIREIADATETLGTTTVMLLAFVAIQGGIVTLLIVAASRGLSPMLSTIQSQNTQLTAQTQANAVLNRQNQELQEQYRAANAQLLERLQLRDEERAQTAAINEGTVRTLGSMETKSQAETSRASAVKIITDHIDGKLEKPAENIATLLKRMDDLITTLKRAEQNRATHDETMILTLTQVTTELEKLRAAVEHMTNTATELSATPITPPAVVNPPPVDGEHAETVPTVTPSVTPPVS